MVCQNIVHTVEGNVGSTLSPSLSVCLSLCSTGQKGTYLHLGLRKLIGNGGIERSAHRDQFHRKR